MGWFQQIQGSLHQHRCESFRLGLLIYYFPLAISERKLRTRAWPGCTPVTWSAVDGVWGRFDGDSLKFQIWGKVSEETPRGVYQALVYVFLKAGRGLWRIPAANWMLLTLTMQLIQLQKVSLRFWHVTFGSMLTTSTTSVFLGHYAMPYILLQRYYYYFRSVPPFFYGTRFRRNDRAAYVKAWWNCVNWCASFPLSASHFGLFSEHKNAFVCTFWHKGFCEQKLCIVETGGHDHWCLFSIFKWNFRCSSAKKNVARCGLCICLRSMHSMVRWHRWPICKLVVIFVFCGTLLLQIYHSEIFWSKYVQCGSI